MAAVSGMDIEKQEAIVAVNQVLVDFFEHVPEPEDRASMEKYLMSASPTIGPPELMGIFRSAAEAYADFPIEDSVPSTSLSTPTEVSSTGGSSATVVQG